MSSLYFLYSSQPISVDFFKTSLEKVGVKNCRIDEYTGKWEGQYFNQDYGRVTVNLAPEEIEDLDENEIKEISSRIGCKPKSALLVKPSSMPATSQVLMIEYLSKLANEIDFVVTSWSNENRWWTDADIKEIKKKGWETIYGPLD